MAEEAGEPHVSVPASYLLDLLARVEDLAELKAALCVLYLSSRRATPAVPLDEVVQPWVLRAVVGMTSPEPAEQRLRRSLDRGVANGLLLRLTAGSGDAGRVHLLPATREHQALVDRLRANGPETARELGMPPDAETVVYRPNVFALYERHIGPLTPLVAERLRDAERSYPRAWVEAAILAAEQYNRRNWRYIEAILSRWEATGGPDGASRRRA